MKSFLWQVLGYNNRCHNCTYMMSYALYHDAYRRNETSYTNWSLFHNKNFNIVYNTNKFEKKLQCKFYKKETFYFTCILH